MELKIISNNYKLWFFQIKKKKKKPSTKKREWNVLDVNTQNEGITLYDMQWIIVNHLFIRFLEMKKNSNKEIKSK